MTEETRKEYNAAMAETLAEQLEKVKGWPMIVVIKIANEDRYEVVLGPDVGPGQFVHALAEIMPGIAKWNDDLERKKSEKN